MYENKNDKKKGGIGDGLSLHEYQEQTFLTCLIRNFWLNLAFVQVK